ncbi:MAG: GNAT family protein [Thermoplasmata archaeon]|jgi:N-acetyltransferase
MRPESFRPPLTLEGRFIRLVPLDRTHRIPLHEVGADPEVIRYLLNGPGMTLGELDSFLDVLQSRQTDGTDLAFTTLRASDSRPVGMTRFLHVDRKNESVEIGGSWLGRAWWRTPFNTEAKFLLMRHAFEVEGVHRVSLQTDLRNERAQRAIERLGANREAVLREDRLLPGGYYRSSVFYSILQEEWPRIRAGLEQKLALPWSAPEDR